MSDARRTLLIAGLLLVVTIVAWFFLYYHPKTTDVQSIKRKTDKLLTAIKGFRVTQHQIAGLQTEINRIEGEIQRAQARIVPKSKLTEVVSDLRNSGRRDNLKFDTILPDYEKLMQIDAENSAPVLKVPLHFKIQGRFLNYGRFLDNTLKNGAYLMSIEEIRMSVNQFTFPELEILMDVILYLRHPGDVGSKERVGREES